MKPSIKINNLTKEFAPGKGVFSVSFQVKAGEVVGFIGPNGAGKTTTLSMLTGLISADSGDMQINGHNVDKHNIYKINSDIGILLADVNFPSQLKVKDIFKETARLYSQDCDWQKYVKALSINLDAKFGSLSLGNKKKVGITCALMHNPSIVIMDEPTSGLDPLIQRNFLELLKEVADNGGLVLLSSHVLTEVQSACDRVVMIKDGEIIRDEKTTDILEDALKRFRFHSLENKVLKELKALKSVEDVKVHGDEILVYAADRKEVLQTLSKHKVYEFYLEATTLEEMFIDYYN